MDDFTKKLQFMALEYVGDYDFLALPDTVDFALEQAQSEILMKESQIQGLKERIDALNGSIVCRERSIDRLKQYQRSLMREFGIENIKTVEFNFRYNLGREKVEVLDESSIPNEYKVNKPQVDKKKLLEEMKAGVCVEGARMVRGDDYITVRGV